MKFKIKKYIISILVVLILLFSTLYLFERNKVIEDAYILQDAMKYLKNCEDIEKGLDICNKMNYNTSNCKIVLYHYARGSITVPEEYTCKNFNLTKEFCESFDEDLKFPVLYNNLPFEKLNDKPSITQIRKLKSECLDFVNSSY